VVGRYAPSPTGELHLGNLRTALLAWLFARSAGSEFLLRIEDIDRDRVREEFVESQLTDIRSLGIDWDGMPVRQSERAADHEAALSRLQDRGLVYPCFCSRREVREATSAQHGEAPEGLYPGTCRELDPAEADRRVKAGDEYALRLRAELAEVTFADRLHGELTEPADVVVLRRRDGVVAYTLAVVVDDDGQGVEEVVRGDDLLPATAAQALIYDLLELERPTWAHVPLVLGPDRERLAKRHGAVTLSELAAEGIRPADVVVWMARTLELAAPAEQVTARDLVGRFDPARIPTEPITFQGPPA
jgi:glutamyl-tRNA synthetase